MQGIYRILNLVTDKWYVGSAKNIGKRWKDHKRNLRKGTANPYLQNSFNKYGAENFILEILREVKGNHKELLAIEQEYLDEWMPTGQLYNLSSMASCCCLFGEDHPRFGKPVSEETRVKLKASWADEKVKASRIENQKKAWAENHEERCASLRVARAKPEFSETLSTAGVAAWADPEKRANLTAHWEDPARRKVYSEWAKIMWEVSEYRKSVTDSCKEWWTPKRKKIQSEKQKKLWAKRSPEEKIAHAERMRKTMAKPYPALYNEKTGKFAPAGINLTKLGRVFNLSIGVLSNLTKGNSKRTRCGWRLATGKEIQCSVEK